MEYVRGHAAFQSWLKWTVESQHAGAFPERAGLVEELEAVVVWRVVQEARQESLLGELQFSRNRVIARSLWHCEHKRKGKRLFANIVKVTIWWRFAATAGPNILQMNNGLKCESVIGMRCKAASNFKRKERMAEKNPPSMNQNLTPNQHKQKNNCRDAGNTDVFVVCLMSCLCSLLSTTTLSEHPPSQASEPLCLTTWCNVFGSASVSSITLIPWQKWDFPYSFCNET